MGERSLELSGLLQRHRRARGLRPAPRCPGRHGRRRAAAEASFRAALALEEAVGGDALAVRTRLAHARALLRTPAERRRAGELLDAAEAAAARLGMAGALAEAAALRAASG